MFIIKFDFPPSDLHGSLITGDNHLVSFDRPPKRRLNTQLILLLCILVLLAAALFVGGR